MGLGLLTTALGSMVAASALALAVLFAPLLQGAQHVEAADMVWVSACLLLHLTVCGLASYVAGRPAPCALRQTCVAVETRRRRLRVCRRRR
jgi:hypothetical protein